MSTHLTRKSLTVAAFILFFPLIIPRALSADADGAQPFPEPEALKPAMQFWERVYTEITSSESFLHDTESYTIYAKLILPELSARAQARWLKQEKRKIKEKIFQCARKIQNDLCDKLPKEWSSKDFSEATRNIRFQLGQRDRFLAGLIRSGRYLDHIKTILKNEGVPEDLAALPHVESSFEYTAYSKVGAAGIWQFMRSTARLYMKLNYMIDQRRDALVSTRSAARLLKSNYQRLGTWPLAITAYNHGPHGIQRITQKLGTTDIETIVQTYRKGKFGFASRNFYAQFLVARKLARDYRTHFGDVKLEPSLNVITYKLSKPIPPKKILEISGVGLDELKALNPAVRPPIWKSATALPKGYELHLPGTIATKDQMTALLGVPPVAEPAPDTQVASTSSDSEAETTSDNLLASLPPAADSPQPKLAGKNIAIAAEEPPSDEEETEEEELSSAPVKGVEQKGELRDMSLRLKALSVVNKKTSGERKLAQIRVEPEESVSNYSEWSRQPVRNIAAANNSKKSISLQVGRLVWVPLSSGVSVEDFESKRVEHHRAIEEDFFESYEVVDSKEHKVRRGDQIWELCYSRYNIPVWLLKRVNPEVDLVTLVAGRKLKIPIVRSIKK